MPVAAGSGRSNSPSSRLGARVGCGLVVVEARQMGHGVFATSWGIAPIVYANGCLASVHKQMKKRDQTRKVVAQCYVHAVTSMPHRVRGERILRVANAWAGA